ncbi:hypothetical protein PI23P_04642 [Polaribacter irgensii 23-P]|uniref:Uncharacterized protein n=1 Tax=Polaribacter irgensii 23-P TaxID=313594 RepID=A4BXR5_9FLAO|nr:hypothetical protein PI23P_04642 [Polaribacter irgensii 23-P]
MKNVLETIKITKTNPQFQPLAPPEKTLKNKNTIPLHKTKTHWSQNTTYKRCLFSTKLIGKQTYKASLKVLSKKKIIIFNIYNLS